MHYHVTDNGIESGPFTADEIRQRMASGQVRFTALVLAAGMGDWRPVGEVIEGSARPPLPASLPPPIPPVSHLSVMTSGTSRRYPKWPDIAFGIALLFWIGFTGHAVSLEAQAQPLLDEGVRMESGEYLVGVGIEAFVRGALGDPFGKAGEEYEKGNAINERLKKLAADYQDAVAAKSLCGWLAIIFGVLWIWQHRSFKNRLTSIQGLPRA